MGKRNGIRIATLFVSITVLMGIAPGVAAAEIFKVTTTQEGDDKECVLDCTLREAVSLAGGDDRVDVPAGTYFLGEELFLTSDTIVGAGARSTIIDGSTKSRVFWVTDGTTSVSGVTIWHGNGVGLAPSGVGGGIFVQSGLLNLIDSTVMANTASTGGGIASTGNVNLVRSTVSGNTATAEKQAQGGGIFVAPSGELTLGNSTVSSNTATGADSEGGGVHSAGALTAINTTFYGNRAASGGGLFVIAPRLGAPSISNTVLDAGTGGACGGPGLGVITSHHNVVSDATCQFKGEGNLQAVDPKLAALDDYGGPTRTHALLPASPAIDAGNDCAQTDQRGVLRPQPAGGFCDVGAFEYRAPTLTVVTTVVNDDGGTSTPDQFDVHVLLGKDDVEGSPQPGSAKGTLYTLDAYQTYTVAAGGVPGYSFAVSGDCPPNGNIGLAEGQNRRCTITANDRPATLRVITTVVNDNGGTRTAGEFFVRVSEGSTDVASGFGSEAGTSFSLDAGSYVVSADAVGGYAFTYSGDCAVTLDVGEVRTCTVTADDKPATLRVVTKVVNDNGGTRTASQFFVRVREGTADVASGTGSEAGTSYVLDAGSYVVSADAASGYTFAFSGDCASGGAVALAVGDSRSCNVTADDQPASLRLITTVVNDNGGTRTAGQFFVRVRDGATDVASGFGSEAGTSYVLDAGSYMVSADAVGGYAFTFSGECAPDGAITLAIGGTQTCTVTADDEPATLRVVTKVVNDNGGTQTAGQFLVRVRAGADEVASGSGNEQGTDYSLDAGSYVVSADAVSGYTFTFSGECGPDGAITLDVGQDRSCTVTARDAAATLRVITRVVNDHGGTATPSAFVVHIKKDAVEVAGGPGSADGTTYELEAAGHVVSVDSVGGYATSLSGDCGADGTITLAVGDSRSCTITANDDPPAPVTASQAQQQQQQPQPPPEETQELPPPEVGKTVNALPESGTVKIKLPGTKAFVELEEGQQIPVGTVIDVRNGRITITAAADKSGGTATADFYGGIFELGQTKGAKPITTLELTQKLSCPKSGKASIAATRKKKRRLWGDGSGRFRTEGSYSSATVRGTRWLTEDTCNSTLTRVVRGRVSVRDFVKDKTVIVKAGQKYVARRRP